MQFASRAWPPSQAMSTAWPSSCSARLSSPAIRASSSTTSTRTAGQHFLLALPPPVRAIAPMAGASVSHRAIVTTMDVM